MQLIFDAVEKADLTALRSLISEGNPVDCILHAQTPLYIASFFGHLECIVYLHSCGANVNHQDDQGYTPLSVAASAGKVYRCFSKRGQVC